MYREEEASPELDFGEEVSHHSQDSRQYGNPIATLVYLNEHGEDDEKLPIYAGKELCIGREENGEGSFFIPDSRVSKSHLRLYSVIYEKEKYDEFQPLVYCEDLESTNGTYINDVCIGMIGSQRIGRLLSHGDIVEIKPSWRFRFDQHDYIATDEPQDPIDAPDLYYFSDRYIVSDRVLGKGNYGSVRLATEIETSKQLACKVVDIQQAMESLEENSSMVAGRPHHRRGQGTNERMQKVMREIKILSKLSHPNIIDLKKTFCSNTHLYIFTELAPGGDLFSYIESHGGTLSDLESRVVSYQIGLALQYMHRQGIAHRDVKPENVLVMHKDFGGRVVLTDFGFANYVHKSSGRLMSRLGTSGFIAPEVESLDVESTGYTPAADLWSLGVLTACLLTGTSLLPRDDFTQNSQQEIADRFLVPHDQLTKGKYQNMSKRSLDFLRNLLAINPRKRMSAEEALQHPWFTKPVGEATALKEAYQRIIRFWRKRDEDEEVMEDLPNRTSNMYSDMNTTSGSRFRKKIPDTSLSPYFGLDRHLTQKASSKRKNILQEINNSGGRFLTSDTRRNTASPNIANRKGKRAAVETVDGRDIFRTSLEAVREETQEDDLDEVSLVPTTIPRDEEIYGFNLSDPASPETSQAPLTIRPPTALTHKRSRVESENEEEKRFRDEVAKTLPKYSSAKALRDKTTEARLEKELASLRSRHS